MVKSILHSKSQPSSSTGRKKIGKKSNMKMKTKKSTSHDNTRRQKKSSSSIRKNTNRKIKGTSRIRRTKAKGIVRSHKASTGKKSESPKSKVTKNHTKTQHNTMKC